LVKSSHRGWEFPGGQVEVGETLEEALVREIWEESGANVTVRCLAGVYSNVKVNVAHDGTTPVPTKVMLDFLCDYVDGELRTSEETSEVRWVPRSEVMSYVTFPPYVMRSQTLLDYSGKVTYSSYTSKPVFQEHTRRLV